MSLIYKTLFEIKLMHEYYLTSNKGEGVFGLSNQKDRMQFLMDQFTNDMPSINDCIEFKFFPRNEKTYNGQYLKLLTTYSGCKVAIRVNKQILPDGTLVFTPFVALPDIFDIFIQIKRKTGTFGTLTHSSLNNPFPSEFVFSNQQISTTKIFPFLTTPIETINPAKSYTQGDVASFGINDKRQFYKNTAGDQWEFIPGNSFANDLDRLLLPLSFNYSFSTINTITEATFVLKNKDDIALKTVLIKSDLSFRKANLDYSDLEPLLSHSEKLPFTDNLFTLEVSANNGYFMSHKILFSNDLHCSENWGLIHIRPKVSDASFNSIASDGFLVKRKIATGIWDEAPIFEIPIKSKFPFLRFINEKGMELNVAPILTDYIIKENKVLLSKRPKSVAGEYFLLSKEGSNDKIYVPNPINFDLKMDQNDRLMMDIMVPESDLFPVTP